MARWEKYRSAKWFQCAMEDARDIWSPINEMAEEEEMHCPFCGMANFDCDDCVFGPETDGGCMHYATPIATCESVWGEFA